MSQRSYVMMGKVFAGNAMDWALTRSPIPVRAAVWIGVLPLAIPATIIHMGIVSHHLRWRNKHTD